MKILVTGGAGFIGSHIVDEYIAAGHDVSILDNFSTGLQENVNPDARLFRVDVRDRDGVDRVFAEGKFDLLNHHTAQLDVRVSVNDPQFDAEENIIGSLNLLQAARRTGVGQVVFASSAGTVYGEQQTFPADEGHSTDPISPYGVAKLSVEKYLGFYRHVYGIQSVILRYTNVYGPRQNRHGEAGVVAIFCDRMLAGAQPVINGSGEQTRDYVYVGDVAKANLAAVDYLERHGSNFFNICTNTEISVNDLFRRLNTLLGDRFTEEHGPAKAGEQMRSVCSYRKAEQELGWSPAVALEEGLAATLDFYRQKHSTARA